MGFNSGFKGLISPDQNIVLSEHLNKW